MHDRPSGTAGQPQRVRRGLTFRTGPFTVRLASPIAELAHTFCDFYGTTELADASLLAHFTIRVAEPGPFPRPFRRKCTFWLDQLVPFEPYPHHHAFPLLEWGLNWCIGTRAHKYLMLHCGAVERGGRALLLPALPGSGKSTLSAALAYRGWRLLTDEIGLVMPGAEAIHPLPRAIPLKNASIAVFKTFEPGAFMGPLYEETRKGDVAHVRPPQESLDRQLETAVPGWIIFPRFRADAAARLEKVPHSETFIRLAQHSFNYRLLGGRGFRELEHLVRHSSCYAIEYGSLDDALVLIEDITTHQ
jgi:HprK-related kinase A